MTITLSPETQKMLEHRMQLNGFKNPDDALRAALMTMEETEEQQEDDRSPETLEAIRRGLADAEAGRTRPWEDVKRDLLARRAKRA